MPRRNLLVLLIVGFVSLICYRNVQFNLHGRILIDAMRKIENRALEPVSQREMFEGAMAGLVRSLGDPYSRFEIPQEVRDARDKLKGQFGGVGMQVSYDPKTGDITVTSPMVGTPAYEAGIRAGDQILAVGGESLQGMSLEDSVELMRGEPGTPVTLTILHEGDEASIELTIVRKIIHVDSVLGDARKPDGSWNPFLEGEDRIGYVRINQFGENTADELRASIDWLIEHEMRGLILDLRGNPGGLLLVAVDVCNMFIASGDIVSTRDRYGEPAKEYQAKSEGTYGDFPMAVLVDGYSASASEIVAACLQDAGRATIVGQRTWGKGTVQEDLLLEGGYGLRLTTLSYWRPSGVNIHRKKDATEDDVWGVMPDEGYEVIVEGEDYVKLHQQRLQRDAYKPSENGNGAGGDGSGSDGSGSDDPGDEDAEPFVDPQLARAVEAIEDAIQAALEAEQQ